MKTCAISGCAKPHKGLGYCEMHLARFKKGSDMLAPTQRLPKGVSAKQGYALRRAARRDMMRVIKAVPCMDCINRFPTECMDFDHVRGEKLFTIGSGNGVYRPWSKILAEIAKCDIVCANCHRIRTYSRTLGGATEEYNWARTSTHLATAVSQLRYAGDAV